MYQRFRVPPFAVILFHLPEVERGQEVYRLVLAPALLFLVRRLVVLFVAAVVRMIEATVHGEDALPRHPSWVLCGC